MQLVLFVSLMLLRSTISDSTPKKGLVLPNPEQNVMPFEPVQYSPPNISNNYQSSTRINNRGMGHLYFITKKFMDFILNPRAFPEGWGHHWGHTLVTHQCNIRLYSVYEKMRVRTGSDGNWGNSLKMWSMTKEIFIRPKKGPSDQRRTSDVGHLCFAWSILVYRLRERRA